MKIASADDKLLLYGKIQKCHIHQGISAICANCLRSHALFRIFLPVYTLKKIVKYTLKKKKDFLPSSRVSGI